MFCGKLYNLFMVKLGELPCASKGFKLYVALFKKNMGFLDGTISAEGKTGQGLKFIFI
jgi:hypothetical protein